MIARSISTRPADGAELSPQLPLGLRLATGARFDTFYAQANAAALAALRRGLAGEEAFVLYLWGGADCGKTHLLQATCHDLASRGSRAGYLPLAEHASLDPGMVEGWDALQCVCIDDAQEIAGIAAWERALFALCNKIKDRQGFMVVTAHAPPCELELNLADLSSRLAWGPIFHLKSLDDAGRVAALQLKATRRGLTLPDETAQYLVRRLNRDMRSLTRTLDQLDRASLVTQRRLTIPFVKAALNV